MEQEQTQNIFDNPVFFEGYKKLRENPDNANNLLEKPAILSLLPELGGKAVLDLGCGFGESCAVYKQRGAGKVLGVDISEKMLAVARRDYPDIEFIRADMNDLSGIGGTYDVILSSMAVHYVRDFNAFAAGICKNLNAGGCFIFSQEHPLTTAPMAGPGWTKDENGLVQHYNLTDYGRSGQRRTTWFVDGVIKYHRTFSDIINALTYSGLVIEKMLEPTPAAALIRRLPKYEQDLHKPIFLLIKTVKRDI